jgi:hypothetical protein
MCAYGMFVGMRKRAQSSTSLREDESVQFTVRRVPRRVARSLRNKARRERKSINSVLVQALVQAAGAGEDEAQFHDLDWLAGTWVQDPAFDAAIAAQDQIDESLWR